MRDLAELNIDRVVDDRVHPPPSAEIIAQFERQYDVRLPEELLYLLRFSNGGHPELFSAPDLEFGIGTFFYLDDDRRGSKSFWANMEEYRSVLTPEMIPFADDTGGGDVWVLDTADQPASVWVCMHDYDFGFYRAAASLEELLDRLCDDPEMI